MCDWLIKLQSPLHVKNILKAFEIVGLSVYTEYDTIDTFYTNRLLLETYFRLTIHVRYALVPY
jgi:hypothetical protein